MCSENTVENEAHFRSHCKAYTALRSKHGYADKNHVNIMNDTNQDNLSFYLTRAFEFVNTCYSYIYFTFSSSLGNSVIFYGRP